MEFRIAASKLPLRQIAEAKQIATKARRDLASIDSERAEYPATLAEAIRINGESYKEKYIKAIENMEERKKTITETARASIANCRKSAEEFIFAQFMPNGNDIIGNNAADAALLEHGLISTPAQLDAIIKRHDNAAFRVLVSNYAAAREWDGFAFIDKQNSMNEYCTQVFNGLDTAVLTPGGVMAMQYCETQNEYARIAGAYGLAEEFSASEGNAAL